MIDSTTLSNEDFEFLLNSVSEVIPQLIFSKDKQGRLIFTNDEMQRVVTAFKDQEGKTDHDLLPTEVANEYRKGDIQALRDNKLTHIIEKLDYDDIDKKYKEFYQQNLKIFQRANINIEEIIEKKAYLHTIKMPIVENNKKIGIQGMAIEITQRILRKNLLEATLEVIEKNFIAASAVQKSLLPKSDIIDNDNLSFAWRFIPSEHIGGDLLNIFQVDEEHFGFYLFDVTGHGIDSALLSSRISRLLVINKDQKDLFLNPVEVAKMLCREFPLPLETGMFCTLIYGIVNEKTGDVNWVRCGHEAPLYYKQSTNECRYIKNDSNSLIIKDEGNQLLDFYSTSIKLNQGDRFYLYSDGIVEGKNINTQEEFGYERISDYVVKNNKNTLLENIDDIIQKAQKWVGGHLKDDTTFLAIQKK